MCDRNRTVSCCRHALRLAMAPIGGRRPNRPDSSVPHIARHRGKAAQLEGSVRPAPAGPPASIAGPPSESRQGDLQATA